MTCGIYALQFNYDKTYIGQSIDIESRISRHIREMKKGTHYNKKIIEAYNVYGAPLSYLLEEATTYSNLDKLEFSWIKEFDSCINGLNIRDEEESILRGPEANSAKYNTEQIEKVFNLLLNPNNSSKYIESITGVSSGNVNCIARGASHLWLKELYPEKYSILMSIKGNRNGKQNSLLNRKGIYYPPLQDPEGNIFINIDNLSEFCKVNKLSYTDLHKVYKGVKQSWHKWKFIKS